ncbi:MAG: hypothetical protein OIF32_08480 [Campylobacterales bacterium]|nr:hypothetical protein [Campylobacterales bacterium]
MSAAIHSGTKYKSNQLTLCKSCKEQVIPKVIFYHNEPDVGVCPNCETKLKRYKNSSRNEDSVLAKVVAFSIVVYLISLFVR